MSLTRSPKTDAAHLISRTEVIPQLLHCGRTKSPLFLIVFYKVHQGITPFLLIPVNFTWIWPTDSKGTQGGRRGRRDGVHISLVSLRNQVKKPNS